MQEDPRIRAIAEAAKELDALRSNWLERSEWLREEVLEFLGSAHGPWARAVHDANACAIGAIHYARLLAKDAESPARLKTLTLANPYNQRPAWLAFAHEKPDAAVLAAEPWDPGMSDYQLLDWFLAFELDFTGAGET